MVTDVQNWLDGATTNYGWLIKNQDETDTQTFRAFWGQQGASNAGLPTNDAPNLIVTYSVPEPASMLLLTAGIPLFLQRRRRGKVLA
jgi:PEP-CTERM motif